MKRISATGLRRPRRADHRQVVAATLTPPRKKQGDALIEPMPGIGNRTVATAWRGYGIQPWHSETFKFSIDPELVAKATDGGGLHLGPPDNAMMRGGEVPDPAWTGPHRRCPLQLGLLERRAVNHKRHGTSTLFAALAMATGQVTAACKPAQADTPAAQRE